MSEENKTGTQERPRARPGWLARMYIATLRRIESPWGLWAFTLISFGNSIILPISPYFLLVPLCYAQPKRWLLFSFLATAGSVGGGMLMWGAGYFFWQAISQWLTTSMANLDGPTFFLSVIAILAGLTLLTSLGFYFQGSHSAANATARWGFLGLAVLGGLALLADWAFAGTLDSWAQMARRLFDRWNPDQIHELAEQYRGAAFWAVLVLAFSPIPYKVSSVVCGVALIDPLTFIIASTLGRGSRLYATAAAVRFGGPYMRGWLERYLKLAQDVSDQPDMKETEENTRK